MKKGAIKLIVIVAISVMVGFIGIFIAFFGFLFLLSGGEGESMVRQIVSSPDETYRVEIISHDDGALGGSTKVRVVEVAKQKELSEIGQEPVGEGESVAGGNWDDYERMTVEWSDNEHFQIVITYDFTQTCDVMDVSLENNSIQTSGWYKTEGSPI